MIEKMFADYLNTYRCWARAVAGVAWGQWRLLDLQYRAGVNVLDALLGGPGRKPDVPPPARGLEERAAERLKQGLAPPRELYDVRNCNRVDWSAFPDWARPSDPELFEGAHEG
jgi:hypothetical protein